MTSFEPCKHDYEQFFYNIEKSLVDLDRQVYLVDIHKVQVWLIWSPQNQNPVDY